jgi:hypothetical protein
LQVDATTRRRGMRHQHLDFAAAGIGFVRQGLGAVA